MGAQTQLLAHTPRSGPEVKNGTPERLSSGTSQKGGELDPADDICCKKNFLVLAREVGNLKLAFRSISLENALSFCLLATLFQHFLHLSSFSSAVYFR